MHSDDDVTQRLQRELPRWRLEGGWIRRTYKTHGWKGTLMVINTVGHLAEAAWHHPDLTASYAWIEVRLKTHTAKGITDPLTKLMNVARAIGNTGDLEHNIDVTRQDEIGELARTFQE